MFSDIVHLLQLSRAILHRRDLCSASHVLCARLLFLSLSLSQIHLTPGALCLLHALLPTSKRDMQAGLEGKSTVFLFTDTQIVTESFLEDINNMLNSGEVPGMFASDEKDRIAGDIREWVEKQGGLPTKEGCWTAFINRVRDQLHIVLAMSPVGEAFRARCRLFPSLVNCCTIDWYTAWPEEALRSVSTKVRPWPRSSQVQGHMDLALAPLVNIPAHTLAAAPDSEP